MLDFVSNLDFITPIYKVFFQMRASTVRVSRGANLLRKFVIYTIFGFDLPQITELRNHF